MRKDMTFSIYQSDTLEKVNKALETLQEDKKGTDISVTLSFSELRMIRASLLKDLINEDLHVENLRAGIEFRRLLHNA